MKTDLPASTSSMSPTSESPAYPLYYCALVKIKGAGERPTRYLLATTQLTEDDKARYLAGENLRTELDKKLTAQLARFTDPESEIEPEKDTTAEYFPHKPSGQFKFTEKLTTGMVEDTDLVASTPHRLFSYFYGDFIPSTTYFWLFTGLVIGTALINLARATANILSLRRSAKQVKAEAEAGTQALELCNSTIGIGNPIPEEAPTNWAKWGLRVDVIFKFLFSISLWYWVLWSIASATQGIGIATIPFSPIIAFTIPLIMTLIQYFGDQTLQYIVNREAEIKIKDRVNFAILEKLSLIDKAAGKKEERSLPQLLTYIEEICAQNSPTVEAQYLIKTPSRSTQNIRLFLSTLVGFGSGFIMLTLIFFAVTPFLGTGLTSLVLPFVASMVGGLVYAVKAFRESQYRSAQHEIAFTQAGNAYRIDSLINKLNHFYQIVLAKRKALNKALTESGKGPATPFAAAADNRDFIFKGIITPKSAWGRSWTKFKQAIHRIVIFAGGTESGSLLFRVIFGLIGGLASLGLATNPLSLTSIGIIMLFIALGWGFTKYCHFLSQKYVAEEKMFLEQSEVYIRSLTSEYDSLTTQLAEVEKTPATSLEAHDDHDDKASLLKSASLRSSTAVSDRASAAGHYAAIAAVLEQDESNRPQSSGLPTAPASGTPSLVDLRPASATEPATRPEEGDKEGDGDRGETPPSP